MQCIFFYSNKDNLTEKQLDIDENCQLQPEPEIIENSEVNLNTSNIDDTTIVTEGNSDQSSNIQTIVSMVSYNFLHK